MTTLVVFKKLRQEHLKEISRRKEYPTHDKKGSALAQALGDQVTLVGVGLLLKCLTLKQLFELASKGGLEEEDEKKKRKTKNSVVKQILQKIQNLEGAQKLFTGLDNKLAKSLKETLEITEKGNDATLFIQEAEAFGLDNCFSTFDIDTLLRFAEGAGLKVDTRNFEAVLECLIKMKNYKPDKKIKKEKKPEPEISKKKPDIKEGITEIDLHSCTELIDYCKEEEIPHDGKKAIVVKRLLKYLAGEDVQPKPKAPKKRKAPPSPKKSTRPTKKQKTGTEDGASEEAMDTDKPSPKKRGRPAGGKKAATSATEGSEDTGVKPASRLLRSSKKNLEPAKKDADKKDDKKEDDKKHKEKETSKKGKKSSSSGSSEA